jgi:phage terminase large subunit-like protein
VTSRNFVVAAVLSFFLIPQAAAQVPFVHQGLIPASVAPGSASFTLTVYGAGFKSSAVVAWNGSPRLTEVISTNQLRATIKASDVAGGQTACVTVINPGPEGGTSNVVFFPVSVQSSSIGFGFSSPYLTSSRTQGLVAGDFNGDGKLDLVWADLNNTLYASLGNGNGSFQAPVSSGTALVPVAMGDFNNDGKLDLVGLNNGRISVALGNGDGTFTLQWSAPVAASFLAVTVADFNQDGKLDLEFPGTISGSNGFGIFLGNGDGTFTPGAMYSSNIAFKGAVAGDFNGDGKVDLATVGFVNGPEIYIYLGNGDGTFQFSGTASYGGLASSGLLFAADMNNDGKLDLVTPLVGILLGNGDGSFTNAGANDTFDGMGFAGIGDFNGDGKLDVAISDPPLAILPGGGNGQFLNPYAFYFTSGGGVAVIGDFNNDGHLDVISDPGNGSAAVTLQIPVSLEPNSLFFSGQNVGTTSSPQTVPLVNVGWEPITVNTITIGGANAASFAQTNNCGATLAANATCNISVTFTPKKGGSLVGALVVSYKGLGTPQMVSLSGTGLVPPILSLKPSKLNFGVVVLGNSSAAQTATLTNPGTESVMISSIAASGAFTQTNNCHSNLGVGGSCQIQVTFTPSAIGISTGTLTVTDNAVNSPQTVSLGGAGTIITVSPLGVNFGDQTVGTTSAAAPVTVSNVGTTAVAISSIRITGTNPGDFAQTNSCGATLAAKTSCIIQVTFTPTATGARSGAVSVTDNGGASPQKVPITGTGT